MLGCHPQSISNYADRGYFSVLKADRSVLVDKESFLRFVANYYEKAKVADDVMSRIDSEIEDYRKMAKEEKKRLKDRIAFLRTSRQYLSFVNNCYPQSALQEYIKAACSYYMGNENAMQSAKSIAVILDFIKGMTYEEVERKHGISHGVARKMAWRGMSIIRHSSDLFGQLKEENEALRKRCDRQHIALLQYRHENAMMAKKKDIDPEEQREMSRDALAMAKTEKVRLIDQDLSIRVLNCLKNAKVNTLCDLLHYEEEDLLRHRNFGRKSVNEIMAFVGDYAKKNPDYEYSLGCFTECV